MAHEIKHGYKFKMCKMPAEPVPHICPPRVSAACRGNILVEQGANVLVGTPLADESGFNMISPVSGRVVSLSPDGKGTVNVEIENDQRMERTDARSFGARTGKTASDMTYEDALAFIKERGIIDNVTGQPLWEMLAGYYGKTDSLVINAVRCAEADMSESAYAVFKPEKLVGGMKILMIALGIRSGTIAVSSCDQNRLDDLFEVIGKEKMIKVSALTAKYPQSDPYMLVYAMSGRELSPLYDISKAGMAVFSAASAVAVYDAFATGLAPNISYLSVGAGKERYLIETVNGTSYKYIADELHLTGTAFINNEYSGITVDPDGYIPYGADTLCMVDLPERKRNAFGCNKCAECIKVCPMYLFPFEFAYSGSKHAKASGALVCIECGLCEYVCPSDIKLTDRIRTLKKKIAEGEGAK